MTPNQTLESIKKGGREEFKETCSFDGVEIDGDVSVFLDSFAEKVWNAALAAVKEKMPEKFDLESNGDLLPIDEMRRLAHYNQAVEESLAAIISLETGV